jgi:hypothetical protein
MTGDRLLRITAAFYGVATLLHTADHLRRGTNSVTGQVFWVGTFGTSVALVAIVFVLIGPRRLAPVFAAAAGFPMAIGIFAVHFLPTWSALSDSFPDGHVTGLSWAAAVLEVSGALAFGIVGAAQLRSTHRSPQLGINVRSYQGG